MLGYLRTIMRQNPTLAIYNDHIRPIFQHQWGNLNTPLHMAKYTLNLKWYMPKPGKVASIQDDKVQEGLFKCIDRMYDTENAGKIHTEWMNLLLSGVIRLQQR